MAHVYHQNNYATPCVWQHCSSGMVPNAPVIGGHDVNGEPIYVGRAVHEGDTIPGKVVASHHVCYVPWGGAENAHHTYQVLTNPSNTEMVWVPSGNGHAPTGALVGGQQSDGTPLYIGRARHDNAMIVGKVHPQHHVLYVPHGGQEVAIHSYEVLCIRFLHTSYGY